MDIRKDVEGIFSSTFEAGIKAGSPTIMVNSAEVDGIPGHAIIIC